MRIIGSLIDHSLPDYRLPTLYKVCLDPEHIHEHVPCPMIVKCLLAQNVTAVRARLGCKHWDQGPCLGLSSGSKYMFQILPVKVKLHQ